MQSLAAIQEDELESMEATITGVNDVIGIMNRRVDAEEEKKVEEE